MPGRRFYFVYLLTNRRRTTLYTGMTRDLRVRVAAHRAGKGSAFTRRYGLDRLVWYEVHENPLSAITREKQIKAGSRRAKVRLVQAMNPEWHDLWGSL